MNKIELVFNHANTKAEIIIISSQLFGYYYSDSMKCCVLVSTGGGVLPVSQTKEEISALITSKEK